MDQHRGKWRVRYTEHELCVLIEGRVRLESVSGEKHELRAGDAFVVPAGFRGHWEVAEPCKKWYAIFEAKTLGWSPPPKSRRLANRLRASVSTICAICFGFDDQRRRQRDRYRR